MLGYLEPSWRPSWSIGSPLGAILGARAPCEPPKRPQGREGRGRVPLPEGKRGFGRTNKISLDHLRPEGWWDSVFEDSERGSPWPRKILDTSHGHGPAGAGSTSLALERPRTSTYPFYYTPSCGSRLPPCAPQRVEVEEATVKVPRGLRLQLPQKRPPARAEVEEGAGGTP